MQLSSTIERVEAPSVEEFRQRYLSTETPVVITGALRDWKACSRWEDTYLSSVAGQLPIPVAIQPDQERAGRFRDRMIGQEIAFQEYLDSYLTQGSDPRSYVAGVDIRQFLPPLCDDYVIPPYVEDPEPVELLWVGAPGSVSQLHYDYPQNLHALVAGRKRFRLFDRQQTPLLYPESVFRRQRHVSQVDLEDPDLGRFPKLERVTGSELELQAGDLLFLPSCMWHQVATLEPSIALNFWWGANKHCREYWRLQPYYWYCQARVRLGRVKRALGAG